MPDQVTHTSYHKQWYTEQRENIALRNRFEPRQTPPTVEQCCSRKHNSISKVARIENGVPGSKEGPIHQTVRVRPAVEEGSRDKPAGYNSHQSVKTDAANSPWPNHFWHYLFLG